jgi:benzoylformate decarboxylase
MPTGHRKLLEQLAADGLTTIFGNPGSSEEGLLDEVARFPDIRYILGLQEAAVVCTADGFAQATGKPAIVQLHTGVGLGTGLGSIYHAFRRQTPMVVLAGEAGVAYDGMEAHMAVDLVGMARPVTKYATRVLHPASLLRLLRRCIKVASTPPCGPVFLAIPQDVLDQNNDEPVVPTLVPETRTLPEPALIAQAAEMLAGAENPVILMGDGISRSGGQAELLRVAEALGARVYGAMVSELIVPWTHPLYCGMTGHMFGYASAQTVADADAVLISGTYVFPDVFPLLTSPFRPDARIVQIDLDAYAIAKNHPVSLGLMSDPKTTLGALATALDERLTGDQKRAATARRERIGAQNTERVQQEKDADADRLRQEGASGPARMSRFGMALADVLPDDAILFDESLTHYPDLLRYLPPTQPGNFFQTPGGTLGVGLPGAVGVKLAHPDRTVVGLTGDGGAMYTYQALWTAAHYGINAKFVVCHNQSYRLLKANLVDYWRGQGLPPDEYPEDFPPPFDIAQPAIDFVTLARALGVAGARIGTADQTVGVIRQMLDHQGPFLVELDLSAERGVARPVAETSETATGDCPCS